MSENSPPTRGRKCGPKSICIVCAVISLLIILAVASLIFYFSSRTADDSNADSGRMLFFIARVLGYDLASMPADKSLLILETYNHAVRKTAHFTEFAALGFALLHFFNVCDDLSCICPGFCIPKLKSGYDGIDVGFKTLYSVKPVIAAVVLSVLYAVSDEVHQIFVDGRAFGISDILIDSAGAVFGISFCLLLRFATVRTRRRAADKAENNETVLRGRGKDR